MNTTRASGLRANELAGNIRPQDDLFGHVNQRWIEATPIPADRGRYGAFDIVAERAEAQLRELLESAARDRPHGPPGEPGVAAGPNDVDGLRDMVGALYASMLQEARCDALGLAPVEADLGRIEAAQDVRALWSELGRMQREGIGGAVGAWVATDDRASDQYIVYLQQSGLGLPDESYYHDSAHADVLQKYAAHLRNVFALIGSADPGAEAAAVLALETRLASGHWDRVAARDSVKSYTKMTLGARSVLRLTRSTNWWSASPVICGRCRQRRATSRCKPGGPGPGPASSVPTRRTCTRPWLPSTSTSTCAS